MMVPMGENVHDKPIVSEEDMEKIYHQSNLHLENLKKLYPKQLDDFTYDEKYFEQLCKKIKCNRGHIMKSLGTLGSGNHYLKLMQILMVLLISLFILDLDF